MSAQSNSILSDPSIIQVTSNSGTTENNNQSNHPQSIGSDNVLSKLLDSAMLNAAKESSPEFEIKPSSSSNSTSPTSIKSKTFDFQATKTSYEFIYTIDELVSMRNLADNSVGEELATSDVWNMGRKSQPQKEYTAKDTKRRNRHNKRDVKKKDDDLEELEPEWNSEFTDNVKLEMGNTVEEFEKWKQAQHRKTDKPIVQESGNDVDNFFSFSKPLSDVGDKRAETSSKASRFSSFFTPVERSAQAPGPGQSQPQQQQVREQIQSQPQSRPPPVNSQSSQQIPPGLSNQQQNSPQNQQPLPNQQHPNQQNQQNHAEDKSSRFFNEQPSHLPPGIQMQHMPPPNMMPPPGFQGMMPPPGFPFPFPPNGKPANDSFFMSLLSKDGQPPNPNPQSNQPNQPNQHNPQQIPPWLMNKEFQGQFPKGDNPNGPPGLPFQVPPGFSPPGMFPPGMPLPPMQNQFIPPMMRPQNQQPPSK